MVYHIREVRVGDSLAALPHEAMFDCQWWNVFRYSLVAKTENIYRIIGFAYGTTYTVNVHVWKHSPVPEQTTCVHVLDASIAIAR